MQALIALAREISEIYGYYSTTTSALGLLEERLAARQSSDLRPNRRIFFGKDDPNSHDAKYQYVQSVAHVINASKQDGTNALILSRSILVLVYALWEDKYRAAIAKDCGLSEKNDLQSDVFQDLNKYRQAIVHANGTLDREPTVLGLFKRGDVVAPTSDQMHELFVSLTDELNRIGEAHYGQSPGFSLDKQLN